jgi:hypothetical protein
LRRTSDSGVIPFGTSSHALTSYFWRPAIWPATAPKPQKKSKRSGPRIAPPVSCASIGRINGLPVTGSSVDTTSGAPSGT